MILDVGNAPSPLRSPEVIPVPLRKVLSTPWIALIPVPFPVLPPPMNAEFPPPIAVGDTSQS